MRGECLVETILHIGFMKGLVVHSQPLVKPGGRVVVTGCPILDQLVKDKVRQFMGHVAY